MDFELELNKVADGYRSQGYIVAVRPGPDQLPDFAKGFRIELLAQRGTERALVAVRKDRDDLAADRDIQHYAEAVTSQPGWRFDFAILEAENPKARDLRGATEFSDEDIAFSLEQAEKLSGMGFTKPAVIVTWAALESAMRMKLRATGRDAGWGSIPRQMVKELYSDGQLSPDEYHTIELATALRNRIVHGFSSESDAESAVVPLLSVIARRLLDSSRLVKLTA